MARSAGGETTHQDLWARGARAAHTPQTECHADRRAVRCLRVDVPRGSRAIACSRAGASSSVRGMLDLASRHRQHDVDDGPDY